MSDEKKIIVDEDWKTRVAAEKESFERQARSDSRPAEQPAVEGSGDAASRPAMPPASFEMLVTTLVTEAMIGLGQLPHPISQQLHRDVEQARYAIDMLEVLAEKTQGNLTAVEERYLRDTLHQLRMAFVAVSRHPAAPDAESASS